MAESLVKRRRFRNGGGGCFDRLLPDRNRAVHIGAYFPAPSPAAAARVPQCSSAYSNRVKESREISNDFARTISPRVSELHQFAD